MNATRASLSILAVGLAVGFTGGYLFRAGIPDAGFVRPQESNQTSGKSLFQMKLNAQKSGYNRDAADATAWAVSLANEAAQVGYGFARFTSKGPPASFDGHRWTWKQRVACGKGDLEAEVWLSPNGMTERLDVKLLIYESVRDSVRKP